MSKYFFESSAFTKRYKSEDGSSFVDQLFNNNNELFYLNLAILEVRKVIFRLWKNPMNQDSPISEQDYRSLESRFASDIQKMKRIEFTEEMINKSLQILETASNSNVWIKTSFDLAQLTTYLTAKEEINDLAFVCADECSQLINAAKIFVGDSYIVIPKDTQNIR